MVWRISSIMSQRHEFVLLASQPAANIRQLCRRFAISRPTGYKGCAVMLAREKLAWRTSRAGHIILLTGLNRQWKVPLPACGTSTRPGVAEN